MTANTTYKPTDEEIKAAIATGNFFKAITKLKAEKGDTRAISIITGPDSKFND